MVLECREGQWYLILPLVDILGKDCMPWLPIGANHLPYAGPGVECQGEDCFHERYIMLWHSQMHCPDNLPPSWLRTLSYVPLYLPFCVHGLEQRHSHACMACPVNVCHKQGHLIVCDRHAPRTAESGFLEGLKSLPSPTICCLRIGGQGPIQQCVDSFF